MSFSAVLILARFLLSVVLTASAVRAQSAWTAIASPARHNLWGACFGGGQFVAVGENGTILTSPDGLAWTSRASGTTAWLTSVDYGVGGYLAVGDLGTILRSRDGIAWEPFVPRNSSRPAARLNVVRALPGRFLIYGEQNASARVFLPDTLSWPSDRLRPAGPWWRAIAHGLDRTVIGGETGLAITQRGSELEASASHAGVTAIPLRHASGLVFFHDTFTAVAAEGAILSSTDALDWSRQPSDTTANLHAIAAFNNTLIAVGENGTILSRDILGPWQHRTSPTAEFLLGVAASDTAAVIVGGNGTILRATPTPAPPAIAAAPASVTETLGGAASWIVRAQGSLPLAYQWHHNGSPLAGETNATLTRAPLTAADAGSYTVTVTNTAGAVTSPAAALNLLRAPAAIIDLSFHAAASLEGTVTALLPLPDGTSIVATTKSQPSDDIPCRIQKLRTDGSLDPAWTVTTLPPFAPQTPGRVARLVVQPDGKILVGGTFQSPVADATPRPHLVRLNPDGTLDPTFRPAATAVAQAITDLALHRDGVLVANNSPVPFRLLANGDLDPGFKPTHLPQAAVRQNPSLFRDRPIQRLSTVGEKIYLGSTVSLRITSAQGVLLQTMIVRLNADGSADAIFPPQIWSGNLTGMQELEDHSLLLIRHQFSGGFITPQDADVVRLRPDSSPAPSYLSPTIRVPSAHYIYPDGRLLYLGSGANSPIRLTALGAPDPTFTGGIGSPSIFTVTADDRILAGGNFMLYNGQPANRVARLNAVPNETVNPPRILALTAEKLTARIGEPVLVHAAVVGSAELTYEWTTEGAGPVRTSTPTFRFSGAPSTILGGATVRLTVRNPRGEATASPLAFTILPAAPVITSQPSLVPVQTGRSVTVRVERNPDSGPVELEWRRDGLPIPRPGEPWDDGQTLRFASVTNTVAGTYTLTFRNLLGETVTSTPIVVTVLNTSRLVNVSTRAHVSPGQPVIAGFVVSGTDPRRVVIRGVGRGLAAHGVTDPLSDPETKVYRGASPAEGGNLDWDNTTSLSLPLLRDTFARVGAFPLETGSRDAAAVPFLAPDAYTVHLSGGPNDSGTALVEIYEADNDNAPILNLSTRATITPASPVIAGFAISGIEPKRILLRTAGPGLIAFGVANALANPRLELRDSTGRLIATNDDWQSQPDAPALTTAAQNAGAFPFFPASRDAALLVTLAPGNYTALATSSDSSTGVALVELYDAPE